FFRSGRLLGSFHGSLLKYNVPDDFQEVFQTISRKSSESLLTESSPMSFLFITNLSVLVFNQMVLIFYMDMYVVCYIKTSRTTYLLVLDDFQKVFQTTSRKSSDEVFFHIKWSPSLSL
ncbi:hypothetical protein IGI04_036239, partial [Brassica rapa subsp. trilocularis]